jgi:tetratricopeptide (TPR) repeat protein
VHGNRTDLSWFEENFPGQLTGEDPFEYQQYRSPMKETSFYQHALGLSYCLVDQWKPAIDCFDRATKLRVSGQAFDWLRLAMAYWRTGDAKAARRWYALAEPIATEEQASSELVELRKEAEKLLSAVQHREESRQDND